MMPSFIRIRRTRGAAAAVTGALLLAALALPAESAAAPVAPTFPIGASHYTVNVNSPDGQAGDIFYTSGQSAAAGVPAGLPGTQPANVIVDKAGHEVWRYTPPPGEDVGNFRTQIYRGHKVLTWWQGKSATGHGYGKDYIADDHYRVIATVGPGDGLTSDIHEFRLTSDGKALITSYREVTADLSAVGGPKAGRMFDCIASVVDVATGKTLFRWDALRHVPVSDTYMPYQSSGVTGAFDPFHMNSIALGPRGDLIISLRHTSTIYDVDPGSGTVNWRLGGKHSTFAAHGSPDAVSFAGQHDAEFADSTTVRLFNNNVSGVTPLGPSSVEWIRLDTARRTATLVREQRHPAGLATFAMGNAQALPKGDTFVGWGTAPHISEFSPAGALLYDASLPTGTYRAYLDTWR
jgi:hypothetical protein